MVGGGGDDQIIGGPCDDTLVGNDGNNVVTGGRGRDRFVFSTGFEGGPEPYPFPGDFGVSTISDFEAGIDLIVLDKATFTTLQSIAGPRFSQPQEFGIVETDADVAFDGASIVYSRESATLFYDTNGIAPGFGEGAAFATLRGSPTLAAADFAIVDWTRSLPSTSTTTLPCVSPRCALERVVHGDDCANDVIPPRITGILDRALILLDQAANSTRRVRRRLLNQATKQLKKAGRTAIRVSRRRRPALSRHCAEAIRHAADGVRADVER